MLFSSALLLGLLPGLPAQSPPRADDLTTVAEQTSYQATSRHADVVDLCRRLAEKSPNAHYSEFGRSAEGRPLPLLIFADPPIHSEAEAARSGKVVVMAIGGIHGGEVCGKEGLLMLARELADEPHPELLKNLIIILAPLLNADGNERISRDERPSQNGPEDGVGTRANARGLDLNRDFIKLEAPETRSLVGFLNRWNPHVFIDTHATNGSRHRYTVTYDGPRNPAGDASLIEYTRATLFPTLTAAFEEATGLKSYYYGTFSNNHAHWESFPALGRFGTNYLGIRNRIGILVEAYSYAPFQTRAVGIRDFVRETLKYTATHKDAIRSLLDEAQKSASDGTMEPPRRIAIRSAVKALTDPKPILGFEKKEVDGELVETDEPWEYPAKVLVDFESVESVEAPYAYLVPAHHIETVALLQRHGIDVRELREDRDLDVEVHRIDEIVVPEATGWDRQAVRELQTTRRAESRRISAGTFLIRSAQPLQSLAVYLLEPRSEDGFAAWNVLPDLKAGEDYPVVRLQSAVDLLTAESESFVDRQTNLAFRFDERGMVAAGNFNGSATSGEWIDNAHWIRRTSEGALKVEALTGRTEPFLDRDRLRESLERIPGFDEKTIDQLAKRLAANVSVGGSPGSSRVILDSCRRQILFEQDQDLYVVAIDGSKGVRLTDRPGEESDARFSPDGRYVSFIRDFDLHIVDVDSPNERPLTSGGKDDLRRGIADWVYFEEIFNRSWSAYWWSPDSQRIAFLEFDDSEVGTLTMLHDAPSPRKVEVNRYPRAGEPNPRVRLGVVAAQGGAVQWADLSGYSAEAFLISAVSWKPDSQTVLAHLQDRVQTWLDLAEIPIDGGKPKVLFRDRTQAWIADVDPPAFLNDGSFLWQSERDGWKHLYHYDADGTLKNRLTSGAWEVRSVQHIDKESGEVYFLGTRDAPLTTQLYKVRPEGEIERITSGTGGYQATVSPDGRLLLATWSDLATPPRVKLYNADGAFLRTVDSNPVHKIQDYRFGPRERVQIPTRDGITLEGELVLPPDLDENTEYPVWFTTYGGPHAPVVTDVWSGGRVWDQALAAEGFIVFRVDPRPASGKGAESAWTAYRKLGLQELEDIKDAIAWLKETRPYVDGDRIGMTGHSYGGYMTAFAMTHSTLFACGIAGAPVTDWHDYDSIYTERLMGLPQDNPEGYKASSVVESAKDLHGKLLIVHGSIDDNVSVRNTMRLVAALQDARKDFELMIYPGARHGIINPHYSRLMVDFIRRNLASPKLKSESIPPPNLIPLPTGVDPGFVHP